MKRTLAAMLTLAFVPALLAGCGSQKNDSAAAPEQTTQQEQTDLRYTLDEIRENNSVKNVLAHHTAMTCTRDCVDKDGNNAGMIREQYTMTDGFIQTETEYTDEDGNVIYTHQGYADKTYPGASYGLETGIMSMTLYPNNEEYEDFTNAWLATADTDSVTEKITGTVEKDDVVIVTVRTDYRDQTDVYDETNYTIDPETNDLLSIETTTRDAKDNKALDVAKTEITYDDPVTFGANPFETIITDHDYCEVTLIVDPQQDDMTVSTYPVAHGTQVSFLSNSDYTLYSDEELTQKIEDGTTIDISGEACNVFAVPNKG